MNHLDDINVLLFSKYLDFVSAVSSFHNQQISSMHD